MFRTAPFVAALCLWCAAVPQSQGHRPAPLTLKATVDSGTMLYLSNGSAWEIRTENRQKAASWHKGELVGVYSTNDSEFPYRLVLRPGKANGEIISAKRLRRAYRPGTLLLLGAAWAPST